MRYVVYGAGAVGGAIGGALCEQGHEVVLIARGEHGREMAANGMRLRMPDRDVTVRPAVVATPDELTFRSSDVVILGMKGQDTVAVLAVLARVAPQDMTVVCAQNGVNNEREAARFFANVVAMCVNLPGVHLAPGEIRIHATPNLGMLQLGRYPSGVSATVEQFAADLAAAGFDAIVDAAVMQRKYAKLTFNISNAFEAACGPAGRGEALCAPLRQEALACYAAAGIELLPPSDAPNGLSFSLAAVDGQDYDGCSSWQSLARGTGAIEADYLNGEIALLGRLYGIATPANELAQRLANHLAVTHAAPGSIDPQDVLDQITAQINAAPGGRRRQKGCAMGMTAAEKILAKAAGLERVEPGDHILAVPNCVVFIDAAPAYMYDWFDDNGLKVWDPDRVVMVFDHFLRTRSGDRARKFAKDQGLTHVFDIGRHGLSHQIPAESGRALPGTLHHNFDTMAATMGGIGCVSLAGTGDSESVAVLGQMRIRVPESIQVTLSGKLADGVTTKDLFAMVRRELAQDAASWIIHFSGPGVATLSVDARLALCNAAAVMGAATALVEPDEITSAYVKARTNDPFECILSDDDATFASTHHFDLSEIGPMVSVPPSPENVVPLTEVAGMRVDQAYIGSCASGRFEDLQMAADVMHGKRVKDGVRMIVTPISTDALRRATATGAIATLIEAGATITTPGCGACWAGNQSPGELAAGENCVTTSTENSPGRMGSTEASIYIANAAVVAASALEGQIADPRPYLEAARMEIVR